MGNLLFALGMWRRQLRNLRSNIHGINHEFTRIDKNPENSLSNISSQITSLRSVKLDTKQWFVS